MALLLWSAYSAEWLFQAAEQLPSNRRAPAPDSEKPLVQPKQTTMPAQGLERIRFASASPSVEAENTAAGHDTLVAFSLPKGMYEFAMRKQIERQTSLP
jgi:hypothetical protein